MMRARKTTGGESMFLTMLGTGNGFTPGLLDSNALLESGNSRTLIDCGTTAWDSLGMLGLKRESIDTIFLTHIHFDHAGGLESIALYSKYVSHRRVRLIVPAPIRQELWDRCLSGGLDNPAGGCSSLEDYFDVAAPAEGERFTLCGDVQAEWFPTRHIPGKFSCGLLMDEGVAYTSDMVCDLPLVESLAARGAETIFHDCQMGDANNHCKYQEILRFPQEIRDRLILIHHDQLTSPSGDGLRFAVQHQRMDLSGRTAHREEGASDPLVERTMDHMRQLQGDEHTGHDWFHTQRVYQAAMRFADMSAVPVDRRTVALAALLHDIADWKFNGGDEEAGPRAARQWLEECGVEEETIRHIQTIIRDLSFKGMGERKAMTTPEGEIVQDADRLDAVGAIGIARAFATGAALGNLILDPDLPPRDNLDSKTYKDHSVRATSVNHFYEKLLHIYQLMNTPQARAEALSRHRYMIAYLQELYGECGMLESVHQQLLKQYEI